MEHGEPTASKPAAQGPKGPERSIFAPPEEPVVPRTLEDAYPSVADPNFIGDSDEIMIGVGGPASTPEAAPRKQEFLTRAEGMLAYGPYIEPQVAQSHVESLLQQIESAAVSGKIETAAAANGATLSALELQERLAELADLWRDAKGDPKLEREALKYLPSFEGIRGGVEKLLRSPAHSAAMMEALRTRAEALEVEETQAREVGEEVLDAAGVKEPVPDVMAAGVAVGKAEFEPANTEKALVEQKVEQLSKQLEAMLEGLTPAEKTGVWMYATALHEHEFTAASKKMGPRGEALKFEYKRKFDELRRLRDILYKDV